MTCFKQDESFGSIKEIFNRIHLLQDDYIEKTEDLSKISNILDQIEKADAKIGAFFVQHLNKECSKSDVLNLEKKLEKNIQLIYFYHLNITTKDCREEVNKYYNYTLQLIQDGAINKKLGELTKAEKTIIDKKIFDNHSSLELKEMCDKNILIVDLINKNREVLDANQKKYEDEEKENSKKDKIVAFIIGLFFFILAAIFSFVLYLNPLKKEKLPIPQNTAHTITEDINITKVIANDLNQTTQVIEQKNNISKEALSTNNPLYIIKLASQKFPLKSDGYKHDKVFKFAKKRMKKSILFKVKMNYKKYINGKLHYLSGYISDSKIDLVKLAKDINYKFYRNQKVVAVYKYIKKQ